MNTQIKWIAVIVAVGIVAAGLVVWIVYFNTPALNTTTTNTGAQFGTAVDVRTTATKEQQLGTNSPEPAVTTDTSTQKIFKISSGPVASATLIQTTRPATSTVVRFVS